jgi:catechol 2,3-dioxygenase-like lactoylglutathione lyase family enzyme
VQDPDVPPGRPAAERSLGIDLSLNGNRSLGQPYRGHMPQPCTRGALHHVELWVPDLSRAKGQWGWLLSELGYRQFQDWPDGRSWRLGETYLVIEQSPAMSAAEHDRLRPGLNHLAFHAGDRQQVDALTVAAPAHGWELLFGDKHPHAGGKDHYAAYLANSDGYEVELVAGQPGW